MPTPQQNENLRSPSRLDSTAPGALLDSRQRDQNSVATKSASPGGHPQPADEAKHLVRLAENHRREVQALARAAQLSKRASHDQCLEITRTNARLGLRQLWRNTGDDPISLRGVGVHRSALRPLTFAVCSAPNLATALRRYQEFRAALPSLPPITIEEPADTAKLSFNLAALDTSSSLIQVSLGLLTAAHRVINWATRRPLILHRVELPHAAPIGQCGYRMTFGAAPVFDAAHAALVFDSDALTRSFVRRHHEIENFLDDAPTNLLAECDFSTSVSAQVRRIIEDQLGNSSCTSDQIAAGIAMSRPTLWRRLREENTSISEIRAEVMREAALVSLAQGDESIAQLSRRLGFSEPSAFSRAFRRWTGHSPRSYQER